MLPVSTDVDLSNERNSLRVSGLTEPQDRVFACELHGPHHAI